MRQLYRRNLAGAKFLMSEMDGQPDDQNMVGQ